MRRHVAGSRARMRKALGRDAADADTPSFLPLTTKKV
jgi:hypothetical protein